MTSPFGTSLKPYTAAGEPLKHADVYSIFKFWPADPHAAFAFNGFPGAVKRAPLTQAYILVCAVVSQNPALLAQVPPFARHSRFVVVDAMHVFEKVALARGERFTRADFAAMAASGATLDPATTKPYELRSFADFLRFAAASTDNDKVPPTYTALPWLSQVIAADSAAAGAGPALPWTPQGLVILPASDDGPASGSGRMYYHGTVVPVSPFLPFRTAKIPGRVMLNGYKIGPPTFATLYANGAREMWDAATGTLHGFAGGDAIVAPGLRVLMWLGTVVAVRLENNGGRPAGYTFHPDFLPATRLALKGMRASRVERGPYLLFSESRDRYGCALVRVSDDGAFVTNAVNDFTDVESETLPGVRHPVLYEVAKTAPDTWTWAATWVNGDEEYLVARADQTTAAVFNIGGFFYCHKQGVPDVLESHTGQAGYVAVYYGNDGPLEFVRQVYGAPAESVVRRRVQADGTVTTVHTDGKFDTVGHTWSFIPEAAAHVVPAPKRCSVQGLQRVSRDGVLQLVVNSKVTVRLGVQFYVGASGPDQGFSAGAQVFVNGVATVSADLFGIGEGVAAVMFAPGGRFDDGRTWRMVPSWTRFGHGSFTHTLQHVVVPYKLTNHQLAMIHMRGVPASIAPCVSRAMFQRLGTCWAATVLNVLLFSPVLRGYLLKKASEQWTLAELDRPRPPPVMDVDDVDAGAGAGGVCDKATAVKMVLWYIWHGACRSVRETQYTAPECFANLCVPQSLVSGHNPTEAMYAVLKLMGMLSAVHPVHIEKPGLSDEQNDAEFAKVLRNSHADIGMLLLASESNPDKCTHVIACGTCQGTRFVYDSRGWAAVVDWRDEAALSAVVREHYNVLYGNSLRKSLIMFEVTLNPLYAKYDCRRGINYVKTRMASAAAAAPVPVPLPVPTPVTTAAHSVPVLEPTPPSPSPLPSPSPPPPSLSTPSFASSLRYLLRKTLRLEDGEADADVPSRKQQRRGEE